jgi:hypothetical protein
MPSSTANSLIQFDFAKKASALKLWATKQYTSTLLPFYNSLSTSKQTIVLITAIFAVPYFLRGHLLRTLDLIKASIQGQEISIPNLSSLLTETFLISYVVYLFISYKSISSDQTSKKPKEQPVASELTFSSNSVAPNYLSKTSNESPAPSRFSTHRFKHEVEIDITDNDEFNNILKGLYENKSTLTAEHVNTFINSDSLKSNSSLTGVQSEVYELLNPIDTSGKSEPIKTMSLLDFLNEEEATEQETFNP